MHSVFDVHGNIAIHVVGDNGTWDIIQYSNVWNSEVGEENILRNIFSRF